MTLNSERYQTVSHYRQDYQALTVSNNLYAKRFVRFTQHSMLHSSLGLLRADAPYELQTVWSAASSA